LKLKESEIKKSSQELPVIICIANLRQVKDHHTLVQALGILKEKGIPFRAWLVGADFRDEYSKSLKRLVCSLGLNDQVEFLGARTDVGELLCQADIGVLSSISEGLPVALLEYGMASLPVIATDVGQCQKVIGDAGLVVPVQHPEKMAEALEIFLSDFEKRVEFGKQFKSRVELYYSSAAVFSQLIGVYQKALSA